MSKKEKEEEQLVREYLEIDGFVKKKNQGKGMGFKDRYLVFGPNGYSLFYYAASRGRQRPKSNDHPKGWVLINKCIAKPNDQNPLEFFLENENEKKPKKWVIQCQTIDERDKWVKMIQFFKKRSFDQIQKQDPILLSLIEFEKKGNKYEDFDDTEVLKQLHLINEKRNEQYLERWEKENQKVFRSIQLEDFIKQHSEFSQYIHYGFLFRKQKFEDLTDKAGNLLKQSKQLWFLMISEIPLFDDEDIYEDTNDDESDQSLGDQAIIEEDIPQGMEQNVIYIFQVTEGEKGAFLTKMVDKLRVEQIQDMVLAPYKKNGNVFEEAGSEVAKTIAKGFGTLINTISSIIMLDRLIGLQINLEDLRYKFTLTYQDNFKDEDQIEKYELCSVSLLQVTEWYEKINTLRSYLEQKQEKIQKRIELRKKQKEQLRNDSDDMYSQSSSEDEYQDDMFHSWKKQVIKQDVLDVISIVKKGEKPKLSFNPIKNLRRLQKFAVDATLEFANKASQLVDQDRMIVLKRESLGIFKDKHLSRIEDEIIPLQEIQTITPFRTRRMKIKYGLKNVYETTVEIRCWNAEDRDEWIFLIESLQKDIAEMKLTINELIPNNKELRNIVKQQSWGKTPLSQIIKMEPKNSKKQKEQQKNQEEDKYEDSTQVSRSSSMYSKYYYYENKLTSGEDVKFDENIMSDVNEKQQKKKSKGKNNNNKQSMWQKFFPCCYKSKVKNSKTKNKQESVKTPLIIDKDENQKL